MAAFAGLIVLSIAVALALVWYLVTRGVRGFRAVVLALAAFVVISATCITVGYFALRAYITDHYEINLVMLRFFVLPPIAAGVIAGLLSAAMFRAAQRREHGTSNV
jgi:hypothetical protein